MKKILLVLFVFVLVSCTNKKSVQAVNKENSDHVNKGNIEIVDQKIKEYITENANDPKSYQPINTIFSDSLTYLKGLESQLYGATRMMEFDRKERRLYGDSDPARYAAEAKSDQKNVDSLKNLMDSLLKTGDPHRIEYYYFLHSCRLRNGYGGLVKSTYKVITDPALNIIKMVEQK